MTIEYKTVEGHPIVRDGEYQTGDGLKAVVCGFNAAVFGAVGFVYMPEDGSTYQGYGGVDRFSMTWASNGLAITESISGHDLIRPWTKTKR